MKAASECPLTAVTGAATWIGILRQADQAVANDLDAGLTTLIGFCLVRETIVGASNGDSAVLVVNAGADCHEVTKNQCKTPPVGFGDAPIIPFAARLVKPWTVLAMSDGVWKYVGWERIKEYGSRLRGPALIAALQQAARLPRTGALQDDFTVGAFHNDN